MFFSFSVQKLCAAANNRISAGQIQSWYLAMSMQIQRANMPQSKITIAPAPTLANQIQAEK
jgi:hypothetical protein